ncbi:SPW repeat domain-containing protein [Paenibacillus cremeus]|uniref:NAD(P)(+) transhydrogenase (Re/Si-specific) subunit beta n=1 Tax=Paenibacillus cremeus TaxID=2163881 RepID=A0A559K9W8_9BACL|nr:SPW repeat protein [Paenibacillus cremeus]TVY08925.1 NAD(P)(+) transhydrogenase (Re/Si-specific) subunit beta [Paenibacillus cremeus]
MNTRNVLAALIGLFFVFAPWLLGFTDEAGLVRTSVFLGAVQFITSILAFGKYGWNTWQNWISFISGVAFIIFPFAFTLGWGITVIYIFLGFATVLLNFYNMNAEKAS